MNPGRSAPTRGHETRGVRAWHSGCLIALEARTVQTAPEYGNLSRVSSRKPRVPRTTPVDLPLLARNSFHYGEQIGGKYRVTGLIGEGGMGNVLSAVHDDLERDVAIKVVRRELLQNRRRSSACSRRRRSRRASAPSTRLQALNGRALDQRLVGLPYVLEKPPRGASPLGILDEVVRFDTETAVDPCCGLRRDFGECLHAKGIVHRDLPPETCSSRHGYPDRPHQGASTWIPKEFLEARDRRAAITNPPQGHGISCSGDGRPSRSVSKPVDPRLDGRSASCGLRAPHRSDSFRWDFVPAGPSPRSERGSLPRHAVTFAPDLPLALEGIILRRPRRRTPISRFGNGAGELGVRARGGNQRPGEGGRLGTPTESSGKRREGLGPPARKGDDHRSSPASPVPRA